MKNYSPMAKLGRLHEASRQAQTLFETLMDIGEGARAAQVRKIGEAIGCDIAQIVRDEIAKRGGVEVAS